MAGLRLKKILNMIIEFHTQQTGIRKKLIQHIRDEIISIVHMDDNISRAEVILKNDQQVESPDNKICEIKLVIPGGDMMVYRRASGFAAAAHEVITELNKLLQLRRKESSSPPDITTSTVKV